MGTNKDKKKEYVNKLAEYQSRVAKLLKNLTADNAEKLLESYYKIKIEKINDQWAKDRVIAGGEFLERVSEVQGDNGFQWQLFQGDNEDDVYNELATFFSLPIILKASTSFLVNSDCYDAFANAEERLGLSCNGNNNYSDFGTEFGNFSSDDTIEAKTDNVRVVKGFGGDLKATLIKAGAIFGASSLIAGSAIGLSQCNRKDDNKHKELPIVWETDKEEVSDKVPYINPAEEREEEKVTAIANEDGKLAKEDEAEGDRRGNRPYEDVTSSTNDNSNEKEKESVNNSNPFGNIFGGDENGDNEAEGLEK